MFQTIPLKKKIAVLNKLRSGQGLTFIAIYYAINEATIRSIKQIEVYIQKISTYK